MTYAPGDRVRCVKAISAGTLPGIAAGDKGEVVSASNEGPYPIAVLWDASWASKRPYKCYVKWNEIELIEEDQ